VTFHDDTAGTDIGTYSGVGYIGDSAFVPPAASTVLQDAGSRSPHQAFQPNAAGSAKGIAVKVNSINHLAYSVDGTTYQSVSGTVTAITGQKLWFQAYKDATTLFPPASLKWRQGHTSADGTQQAVELNFGNPVNPIQVSFLIASASPADTSQDVTAIVGTDFLVARVVVTAPTITLAVPDPAGRPDKGDGTNQFVYDATANGLLNFPGSINVAGGTADITAFIMRGSTSGSRVALTLDLPAESIAKDWNLYDQSLLALVPADTIAVKNGPYPGPKGTMSDGFLYAGLPKNSTGFGNHLVTLNVDAKPTQQAHIQTFFSLKASNWPGSDGKTPNWFHYWSMTSAYYGTPVYENGSRSQTIYDAVSGKWTAYIDNDTVSGTFPSYENATGIDAFAWICRHEAQHVENFVAWWGNTPLPGITSAYDPSKDIDRDSIPDSLEHDLGMKFHPELKGYDPTALVTPKLLDHFHYGSDYNDDEDYTQHMQRQNHPWTNGSADKEDWASPGHQKK